MTRKAYYTYTYDENGATFDFADGSTIELEWAALNAETRLRLMAHGLKQKTIDAGAIPCDPDTGRPATEAAKIAASTEVFARVARNEWTAPREGGARQSGGLLLRALMQHTGKDRATIEAFLAGKSGAEKTALRKMPAIAQIIDSLRPAPAGIDVDVLMADLL